MSEPTGQFNLASMLGYAVKFNKVLKDIFDGMGNWVSNLQLRKAFNVNASLRNPVNARHINVGAGNKLRLVV
jgi:hypothetical protein